jgi:arylsulfatase
MHGKGSNAYREQNQVPMHIVHPDVIEGKSCSALTSHIDIVPALVSMAGSEDAVKQDLIGHLKGQDMSGLLNNPGSASVNELREAILYNFNMLIYLDPDYTTKALGLLSEMGHVEGPKEIAKQGLKPDLNGKRGAIRSVFDGRYKFNRYVAPTHHNKPKTMDELVALNDLELFDHKTDPDEAVNLAADSIKNREIILAMNAKMNAIIEREVGVDDGSSMRLDEIKEFSFATADV